MKTKITAYNIGLAKVAVLCFIETFVQGSTFVLRMSLSGKNRHLRQARKTLAATFKRHCITNDNETI